MNCNFFFKKRGIPERKENVKATQNPSHLKWKLISGSCLIGQLVNKKLPGYLVNER